MLRSALIVVAAIFAVAAVLNRDEVTKLATAVLAPVDDSRCKSVGPFSEPQWASQRSTKPAVVTLGEGELLAGIPGEGPLRADEVRGWLAEPSNHTQLDARLPVGLDQGVLDRKGLAENPLTRAKTELGRQLFFDPRLSADGTVSCATCHDPTHGYAEPRAVSVGIGGQQGVRNAPTVANRILSAAQFWDGRAESLEQQAIGPMHNPLEMGSTHAGIVDRLRQIEGYRLQFEQVFGEAAPSDAPHDPESAVTIDNVALAIACFERALVTGPTAWDHHVRLRDFEEAYGEDLAAIEMLGDEELDKSDVSLLADHAELKRLAEAQPLSESARRGAEVFRSPRAGCAQCHAGVSLSDEQYHNLGIGLGDADPADDAVDWGRFVVTGNEADRGAFKTPMLRNVADTAPYMHDGSLETLEQVVDWYVQGGKENLWLSEKIGPLDLTEDETADLVAFLKSLSGELPRVETGRLPE